MNATAPNGHSTSRTAEPEPKPKPKQGAQATRRRMLDAEESQRKRLARDLHDALGQPLTALRLNLGWLASQLAPSQQAPDQAALQQRAVEMEALLASTLNELRRLCMGLRPAALDKRGLPAAISHHLADFEQRTGLRCTLVLQDDIPWHADRSTAAFRVLQESLSNVVRHADASQVRVALYQDAQGRGVLEVSDDGCGIDPCAVTRPGALGLVGMRERATLHYGHLQTSARPGGGTTVRLCLPGEPADVA